MEARCTTGQRRRVGDVGRCFNTAGRAESQSSRRWRCSPGARRADQPDQDGLELLRGTTRGRAGGTAARGCAVGGRQRSSAHVAGRRRITACQQAKSPATLTLAILGPAIKAQAADRCPRESGSPPLCLSARPACDRTTTLKSTGFTGYNETYVRKDERTAASRESACWSQVPEVSVSLRCAIYLRDAAPAKPAGGSVRTQRCKQESIYIERHSLRLIASVAIG